MENGITAYATVAESLKEKFVPYFQRFLTFIQPYLTGYNESHFKQFKGQLIEGLTITCASVGMDAFRPHIQSVVQIMLEVQNRGTDGKDPMRTYIFGAWQRLCLLLKEEFAPFLPSVIPSLFKMAALNPEMSIQGGKEGNLTDILHELAPANSDESKKTINVNTSETEEKDVAIQMLIVFIDELGAAFADYVEPTSKILLAMVDFDANSSIRSSVASAFPGLVTCVKKANPGNNDYICRMGKTFLQSLWEAIKTEIDTDTLTSQIQSMKMIIDEVEVPFMEQEVINQMAQQMFDLLKKSEDGVIQCSEFAKNNKAEDEDEEEDEDEAEMIKEEIKTEQALQLSLGEFFGTLFKTHKPMCSQLVTELFALLPKYITNEEKHKQKFGLYILDDMVEFLGPDVLGQHFSEIGMQIIRFATNEHESLRQAASYGVGQLAKHSGAHFASLKPQALEAL